MIPLLFAVAAVCSVARTDAGKIARSRDSVRQFRKANPCPATGKTMGACRGWVVDHLTPICAGGKDAPENMVWQELAESREKDKAEVALCKWIAKECGHPWKTPRGGK